MFTEDRAGLFGLAIGATGPIIATQFNSPAADGVVSNITSVVLAAMAGMLVWETEGLLIVESADPNIVTSITAIAQNIGGIIKANGVLTG